MIQEKDFLYRVPVKNALVTADITKLRTIVINLIDALSTSGLIRQNSNIE